MRKIIKITPSPYLPFHIQPHSVTECSTFSSLQCRAMGDGGLWSVHKGSSLLFLPSHNFPLLQSGSFRINLLLCGLFTGCISFRSQPHALPCHDSPLWMQGNFCSGTRTTSSHSSSSHLSARRAVSHTLLLTTRQDSLLFLTHMSP